MKWTGYTGAGTINVRVAVGQRGHVYTVYSQAAACPMMCLTPLEGTSASLIMQLGLCCVGLR